MSGGDPQLGFPSSGGSVDGACGTSSANGMPAARGVVAMVELGGSVSAGNNLETNGSGQAVGASGGTVVARALEGGTSGDNIWIAFTVN